MIIDATYLSVDEVKARFADIGHTIARRRIAAAMRSVSHHVIDARLHITPDQMSNVLRIISERAPAQKVVQSCQMNSGSKRAKGQKRMRLSGMLSALT